MARQCFGAKAGRGLAQEVVDRYHGLNKAAFAIHAESRQSKPVSQEKRR